MKKTLLASAALALVLGMSGSAFAGPGSQAPENGVPHQNDGCVAGQAGVVVLGLRDAAKGAGKTPGELVAEIRAAQPTPGADDFVQGSHAYCDIGRGDEPS